MWDIICGDIKAAGVSAVKLLGYSLPVPEDGGNTPSGRGNTLADDRLERMSSTLFFVLMNVSGASVRGTHSYQLSEVRLETK